MVIIKNKNGDVLVKVDAPNLISANLQYANFKDANFKNILFSSFKK